jgi:hypothetical protein
MCKKKYLFLFLVFGFLLISPGVRADETELFSSVQPDVLILLDLSGSMAELPNGAASGSTLYIPSASSCSDDGPFYTFKSSGTATEPEHSKACYKNYSPKYVTFPVYSTETCTEPYYKTSSGTHTYNCTKIQIAKRAMFDLLDDDNNGVINSMDMTSLGVRIGYMRFWGVSSDETSLDYESGSIKLIQSITTTSGATTPYSSIYCGTNSANCTPAITSCGTGECVASITASGMTPLATSQKEIKLYLDAHKASDSSRTCRKKFAIIVTDGEDTISKCGASSSTTIQKRRMSVVAAKALADEKYNVFVVGFGNMETYLQNILNWMAYYGGTDNPLVANSSVPNPAFDATMDPCVADSYGNDPSTFNLSGYAFFANNASELTQALKYSFSLIKEATYAFSAAVSVAALRTVDENYLYAASFTPRNQEPFWQGYLKKYQINTDGSVGSVLWDAGSVLASTTASSRNIWTYKGGSGGAVTAFDTTNMTYSDLNIDTADLTIAEAERNLVVGFIRGDTTYNIESWKLGDIFRSNPITVPTPSAYFFDTRDTNDAFSAFRTDHPRTTANGMRLVTIGANDGQFHAFRTDTGAEMWSFIPPNFLPKLKNIAHNVHPTGLTHLYFVDGSTTLSDIWIKSLNVSDSDTAKNKGNWRTLLVFGEGRGVGPNIWSSSASCSSDFKLNYTAGYGHYCGYHALDVTDSASTSQPIYKWHLTPVAAEAPALGEPWSKMVISRVIINGEERWVGFIGAGYNAGNCTSEPCDKRGKGFFVIDLSNGTTVWSVTHDGTGYQGNANMDFSLPANPLILDVDRDGFVDTAYIADIGGNMWRFRFCTSGDPSTCNTTNWRGSMFYQRATGAILPIYTAPTATKDPSGNLWIYWGTGDKVNPVDTTVRNKFFAMKDGDFTSTWTLSDLENIDSSTYTDTSAKRGFYINFSTGGEKMLYDPTVYGGAVYFTTYLPDQSGDPCSQAGTSYLWGINYLTGAGVIPTGTSGATARSKYLGIGMASGVVVSLRPGTSGLADIYVTIGGGTAAGATVTNPYSPPGTASMTNILYWRDQRIK